jgi:hypothetical protein
MLHAVPTDYPPPRHGGRAGWLRMGKNNRCSWLRHSVNVSALSPCAEPVRISRKARWYPVEVGTADARSRHLGRLMSVSSYAKAPEYIDVRRYGLWDTGCVQLRRFAIFGFLSR